MHFSESYSAHSATVGEHARQLEAKMAPLVREIVESAPRTRQDVEFLYGRIVTSVILRSGELEERSRGCPSCSKVDSTSGPSSWVLLRGGYQVKHLWFPGFSGFELIICLSTIGCPSCAKVVITVAPGIGYSAATGSGAQEHQRALAGEIKI